LQAAHIFRPQIARQGLVVEAINTKEVR
jgi:hypothetical protein